MEFQRRYLQHNFNGSLCLGVAIIKTLNWCERTQVVRSEHWFRWYFFPSGKNLFSQCLSKYMTPYRVTRAELLNYLVLPLPHLQLPVMCPAYPVDVSSSGNLTLCNSVMVQGLEDLVRDAMAPQLHTHGVLGEVEASLFVAKEGLGHDQADWLIFETPGFI